MTIVFVYGTLMKEYGNHIFIKDAEFVGKYKTLEKYILSVDDGIPYISNIDTLIPKTQVCGEVYIVNDQTLKSMDFLEGNGEWYTRKQVMVYNDTNEVLAWVYFNPKITDIICSNGSYDDYVKYKPL